MNNGSPAPELAQMVVRPLVNGCRFEPQLP
jgi:hypothetical protein